VEYPSFNAEPVQPRDQQTGPTSRPRKETEIPTISDIWQEPQKYVYKLVEINTTNNQIQNLTKVPVLRFAARREADRDDHDPA
jgi:hypothetical protein